MIIVLKPGATREDAEPILQKISEAQCKPLYLPGTERIVIGALGDERVLERLHFASYPVVESVTPILAPYKLVSRELHPHDTLVRVGNLELGGHRFVVIAGPCAVESREQICSTAEAVKRSGAKGLRGGAYKPRTSPYAFQGLGVEGLKLLKEASALTGLPVVTEVMDTADVETVASYVDAVIIGARNMQNFSLLKAVGQCGKPVILKRGMSARISEFLMAAEYIVSEGNNQVILCERGIRTFDTYTRNTLDLSAIPYIKEKSHLPILVDPSHGTGVRRLVAPMARAAVAVGADGLLIEVHPCPAEALSDGEQSLHFHEFDALMRSLEPLVVACGRSF